MTKDMFVILIKHANDNICGYAGGADHIVYDIHRAAIFRDEQIAKDARKTMQRTATAYPIEFTVVKVELKDVI